MAKTKIYIKYNKAAKEIIPLLRMHKEKQIIAIRTGLQEGGEKIVDRIKQLIKNPPKTGRSYYFRGEFHQASAAGEAPANRTGRLMKSAFYRSRLGSKNFRLDVGSSVPYAKYLELGTKKIAPRPLFSRAGEELRTEIPQLILDKAKTLLNKRGI